MLSNDRARVCGFTLPDSEGYAAEFPQKFGSRLRRRMRPAACLREIARNMGIPEDTVLARAKREGWTREIQNAKALAKREDAVSVTPLEAVALSMQQRGERHLERMAGISERGVDHVETMDGPQILNSVDEIEKLDKVARRTFGLKDDNPYSGFSLNVLNMGALQVRVGDRPEDLEPGVSE